ncbi:MAG: serine/threonine dehydratase [Rickettsiaceae bacterium]
MQTSDMVAKAYSRISNHIHNTPLLYSETLNKIIGSNVYFKMDAMQKTGSFKLRGVLNHLLAMKENGNIPSKIVAYSTGNHALAMSHTAKLFGIHARVYLPENVSPIKKRIAKYYGAEVIEVKTRSEAEELSQKDAKNGFYYLHPSDDDKTIAGAGTMCYEALIEMAEHNNLPNAIFASCGGGGLLAGTYLAKELLSPSSKVIGAEPEVANDAYISLRSGKIKRFHDSPNTIADGLRALSICERTFSYLKKLDGFYTCSEASIYYWTAWLMQTMKVTCEPSASVSMAVAYNWLKENNYNKKNILILVSGGNVDPSFYLDLWNKDHLVRLP